MMFYYKDPRLNTLITEQLDGHLVLKGFVLSVDVHRRVTGRGAGFLLLLLSALFFLLPGHQVAVGGHADIVFLEGGGVSH